jgi:hypothetical protein
MVDGVRLHRNAYKQNLDAAREMMETERWAEALFFAGAAWATAPLEFREDADRMQMEAFAMAVRIKGV